MNEPYDGAEPATEDTVVRYLLENWRTPQDEPLTRNDALNAIGQHEEFLAQGQRMGSYAYYVGDQVAEAAGLEPAPESDEEQSA